MFGTKVEITLPKAEPGHWSNLDFPKAGAVKIDVVEPESVAAAPKPTASGDDSDVDLDEIEPLRAVKITES